jgi:hypothetical protein
VAAVPRKAIGAVLVVIVPQLVLPHWAAAAAAGELPLGLQAALVPAVQAAAVRALTQHLLLRALLGRVTLAALDLVAVRPVTAGAEAAQVRPEALDPGSQRTSELLALVETARSGLMEFTTRAEAQVGAGEQEQSAPPAWVGAGSVVPLPLRVKIQLPRLLAPAAAAAAAVTGWARAATAAQASSSSAIRHKGQDTWLTSAINQSRRQRKHATAL